MTHGGIAKIYVSADLPADEVERLLGAEHGEASRKLTFVRCGDYPFQPGVAVIFTTDPNFEIFCDYDGEVESGRPGEALCLNADAMASIVIARGVRRDDATITVETDEGHEFAVPLGRIFAIAWLEDEPVESFAS